MSDAIKKVEKATLAFPTNPRQAVEQLAELQLEEKKIKSRITGLKKFLGTSIPLSYDDPENPEKVEVIIVGVRHLMYPKNTVSWAKVYTAVLDRLLPKTRHVEAGEIVEEFTSSSDVHTFKPDDEGVYE